MNQVLRFGAAVLCLSAAACMTPPQASPLDVDPASIDTCEELAEVWFALGQLVVEELADYSYDEFVDGEASTPSPTTPRSRGSSSSTSRFRSDPELGCDVDDAVLKKMAELPYEEGTAAEAMVRLARGEDVFD